MRRLSVPIALLSLAASAFAGGPPAPTATDSFARDAWMCRKAHPLTVKLIEYGKTGGQNVPVTMAIGCGENDYAVGRLCPAIDGKPIPAQVDVLATWPDGSIKHAMVSLIPVAHQTIITGSFTYFFSGSRFLEILSGFRVKMTNL